MGYNDSHRDHHEQTSLLGGTGRLLTDDYKALFGDGVIRHSDFRVDNIRGIKITVRGPEDYDSYVDEDPELVAEFSQETNRSKQQFGQSHWADYVDRKSGVPSTTDQHVMKYDNVISEHVWNAPGETDLGKPQSTFQSPVSVVVKFGQSVEFEVLYNNMSDKFENFRRYMSANYVWQTYKPTGTSIPSPVAVTTTNGCSHDQHAFQARYVFTSTQFEPGQRVYMSFQPNDRFNNHDNMSSALTGGGPTWPVFCVLEPQPIGDAIAAVTDVRFPDDTETTRCVDQATNVEVSTTINGLTSNTTGIVDIKLDRHTSGQTQQVSAKTGVGASDLAFTHLLPVPVNGQVETYTFSTECVVRGSVLDHLQNPLSAWSYTLQSPQSNSVTLARASSPGLMYCSDVTPDPVSTAALPRLAKKSIQLLQPRAMGSGYALGSDRVLPSLLVDATQDSMHHATFFAEKFDNCDAHTSYLSPDLTWEKSEEFHNVSTILGVNDPVIESSSTMFGYTTSFPVVYPGAPNNSCMSWRISQLLNIPGSDKQCESTGGSIDIVTVSSTPQSLESLDVEAGYSDGSFAQITWEQQLDPVFTVVNDSGPAKEYMLKSHVEVTVHDVTNARMRRNGVVILEGAPKSDPLITSSNNIVISPESNTLTHRKFFLPGKQLMFTCKHVWTGGDMFNPARVKRWESVQQTTPVFTVLDCSDTSFREVMGVDYVAYVNSYGDLGDAYKTTSAGRTKAQWGEDHWKAFGVRENRVLPHETSTKFSEDHVHQIHSRHSAVRRTHASVWERGNKHVELNSSRDIMLGGAQYAFMSTQALTWSQAKQHAIEQGGKLVCMNTQFAMDRFLRWWDHVGRYDSRADNRMWIGLDCNNSKEIWADGTLLDRSIDPVHWWLYDGYSFGSSVYGTGCGTILDSDQSNKNGRELTINDTKSNVTQTQYIIEFAAAEEDRYDYSGGSEFIWIHGEFTPDQAREDAIKKGGRLAVLDTLQKNQLAATLIPYDNASYDDQSRWAWIGLMSPGDDTQWRWANGQALQYSNWIPGEPNNHRYGNPRWVHINYETAAKNNSVPATISWTDTHRLFRSSYLLEVPVSQIQVSQSNTINIPVLDVTCAVDDQLTISFSGELASLSPGVSLQGQNTLNVLSTREQAETPGNDTLYYQVTDDRGFFRSSTNPLNDTTPAGGHQIDVTPVNSQTHRVIDYHVVMHSGLESNDVGGVGNRGSVEITKGVNNVVDVHVTDINNGPSHQLAATGLERGDLYRFSVFATCRNSATEVVDGVGLRTELEQDTNGDGVVNTLDYEWVKTESDEYVATE